MMNSTLRKVTACVCYTALIVIALGLIFGPLICFSQVAGRPASETYVAAKINAHASTNNAHADIRAQVFSAITNVNALTIAATNATEAAHAATVQANAAILKNTQQDVDISYLYASNANTIAIANLANTRAQAANVTNAQNGAAIASVSNLTVTAQATANAAAAIPRDRIVTQDGSQWIDATGGVWRVVEGVDGWALTLPSYPYEAHVGEIDWYAPAGYSEYADPGSWALYVESTGTGFDISVITGFGEWGAGDVQPTSPITLSPVGMGAEGDVTLWLSGDVNTSRVDGVAWQSDLPLYATTQQVAAALAPMATTQHVAEAIASQLPGIIMSNAVSQMTIYTNASGAATSWWQVASGVTNSGTFASGTPGAITNGQTGPLTLGQMQMIENGNVGFGGTPETGTGWPLTVTGSSLFNGWVYVGGMILTESFVYNAGGYAFKTWNGDLIDAVSWSSAGNVSMPSGNLTVAKTNTAAVVSSQSGYLLPHLGTNTTISLIFTNGTIQAWEIAQ